MSRVEYWKTMARRADLNSLARDLHPSWNSVTQQYDEVATIPDAALEVMGPVKVCLDFGAGLGRNINALKGHFPYVIAYDTSPMVKRLMEQRIDTVATANWSMVEDMTPDLIYDYQVFQHMDHAELIEKLDSIATFGKFLLQRTRPYSDEGRDYDKDRGGMMMIDIISNHPNYEPVWCSIPLEECAREESQPYDIVYRIVGR